MTHDDLHDGFAIIDAVRSVPLDAYGAPGFTLAIGVLFDGTEVWGVVARSAIGDRSRGFPMDTPNHEFEGEIVGLRTKRFLALAGRDDVPRCGVPMTNGRPCRLPVIHAGDHCYVHTHRDDPPQLAKEPV
jgi:hypothetical protein